MHFREKKAFQDEINMSVFVCCREQHIEPIDSELYPLDFTYDFRLIGNSLDTSNTSGMQKAIEDGLRYAKILKDDSRKYVGRIILDEGLSERNYNYCIVTWNKSQKENQK